MKHMDSFEAESLKKMIENKKQFLKGSTGKSYQYLQKEIMFLQNEILPLVLKNTNIAHHEVCKYVTLCFEAALKYKCDGLLFYIPINEDYKEQPTIGVVNERGLLPFGSLGGIEVAIINMDGNKCKVKPMNLPLNPLLS